MSMNFHDFISITRKPINFMFTLISLESIFQFYNVRSNGNLQYISFYKINSYEFKATDTQLTKEPSKTTIAQVFLSPQPTKRGEKNNPSLLTST